MKITVYEFLNDKRDQYRALVQTGTVSWMLERNMELYEYFNNELKQTGSKMQAANNTGERFKVCERTVFNVIEKLSQEVPQV